VAFELPDMRWADGHAGVFQAARWSDPGARYGATGLGREDLARRGCTLALPEALAASITFLLSSDGVNVNGVVLPSDGGESVY